MKLVSVFVLAVALAGCDTNQGTPNNAQASRTESCKVTSEQEIAALFDRWNQSLQTGDPHKVVVNYAERSILLPTVSNKPRLTPAEKEDYFHHFLENRPSGKIDLRSIELGCKSAVDAEETTVCDSAVWQMAPRVQAGVFAQGTRLRRFLRFSRTGPRLLRTHQREWRTRFVREHQARQI